MADGKAGDERFQSYTAFARDLHRNSDSHA